MTDRLKPETAILNGDYIIKEYLGEGGQGQVYLAYHQTFDPQVIKRLHPHVAAKEQGRQRFRREAGITNELHRKNIKHVIFIRDFREDQQRGEYFSVMEYANGGSLAHKLELMPQEENMGLPVEEAIQIAINLCQALAPVHAQGYIHGDLKPGNILFHNDGSNVGTIMKSGDLKLGDFGSAFKQGQIEPVPSASCLLLPRTMSYCSPELLEVSNIEDETAIPEKIDHRSDIYAVGVILYEMLIGRPPFFHPSSESDTAQIRQVRAEVQVEIINQLPPDPIILRPEILPSLNQLVMKALAKNPAERFASVIELQERLKQVLQEEKVDDEQRLAGLYRQIQQKMQEEVWLLADKLIKEGLKIAPEDAKLKVWQEDIADQLLLNRTLVEAGKAKANKDWKQVVLLCREVIDRGHKHREISALLKEAEAEVRIDNLRRRAAKRREQGDKPGELQQLKKLLEEIPANESLKAEIETLEKEIELETLYQRGKQAYEAGNWPEAVKYLAMVIRYDSFYKDAAQLHTDARKQNQVSQTPQRIWLFLNYWQKVIIGALLIIVIFLLIQAASADPDTSLGKLWMALTGPFSGEGIAYVTATPTPTFTSTLPPTKTLAVNPGSPMADEISPPTPTLAFTSAHTPTSTMTPMPTPTKIPTYTPTATSTTTSTIPPTVTATKTAPPTATLTEIPPHTLTATPIATQKPTSADTATFTPSPGTIPSPAPTVTPTPTYALGLILGQDGFRKALNASSPTVKEGFQPNCTTFGEAFAYRGNKIYYKLGRISDAEQKQAIAQTWGLDVEDLEFDDKELKNKAFEANFSENLEGQDKGINSEGDLWINVIPSDNSVYTITLTLSDTQKIIAGPTEFYLKIEEGVTPCGGGDGGTGGGGRGPTPRPTP